MALEADDQAVRLAAFAFLDEQIQRHGEAVPLTALRTGFNFQGTRVPLSGPQGIFKPAVLAAIPLSITTVPVIEGRSRPYEDAVGTDGLLRYRYRGTDPNHHENVGLRRAMTEQVPLIYFHGVVPGQYLPVYPVFVVGDNTSTLTFTIAVEDRSTLFGLLPNPDEDVGRRRYVTRMALQRLHQADFRTRVLAAYRITCAVCRLRHRELLDAAHILPDTHPLGDPVVANGLALCKLHHAAFDSNILGIRPDLLVEIRVDILEEIDGPMLRYGLQGTHGTTIGVPRAARSKPNPDFLAERYEEFRRAG